MNASPPRKASKPAKSVKSVSLKWSGCSDIGKVRKNNEDSFLGLQFDAREIFRLGKFGGASLEKMISPSSRLRRHGRSQGG